MHLKRLCLGGNGAFCLGVVQKGLRMAAKKGKKGKKRAARGTTLAPLGDRVLVERLEAEEWTSGGIVLPDSAKEKPIQGKVVAIGEGRRTDTGKLVALEVKPGNRILFGKFAGTEVKCDGDEYLIMKEDDILAIVEG